MLIPIVFLHKSGEEVELGVDNLMLKNEEEFVKHRKKRSSL
ncbi:hypothetical protein MKZ17_16170 [Solibacillus sp. FSL R7-0682]